MVWPVVAAAAFSTVMDAIGTQQANATNRKIAQRQMDFQERMSSTAYTRAVADLRNAGLNPALAYSQGGASTPSGASYEAKPIQLGRGFQEAASAFQTRQLQKAQVTNVNTNSALNHAKTNESAAQTAKLAEEARLARNMADKATADRGLSWAKTATEVENKAHVIVQRIRDEGLTNLNAEQAKLVMAQLQTERQRLLNLEAEHGGIRADSAHKEWTTKGQVALNPLVKRLTEWIHQLEKSGLDKIESTAREYSDGKRPGYIHPSKLARPQSKKHRPRFSPY